MLSVGEASYKTNLLIAYRRCFDYAQHDRGELMTILHANNMQGPLALRDADMHRYDRRAQDPSATLLSPNRYHHTSAAAMVAVLA